MDFAACGRETLGRRRSILQRFFHKSTTLKHFTAFFTVHFFVGDQSQTDLMSINT